MDTKAFGTRLRQAREQARLSQEELAEAVGKDQRSISEYETGKRRLAVTDLPLFASALQVSLIYFFEQEADVYGLDQALLEYFHQLPSEEDKQAAVEILRVLLKVARN